MTAKLSLMSGSGVTTTFEVRESDEYSGMIFLKITRDQEPIGEVFIENATQLDILSSFLSRQSTEIRFVQQQRRAAQETE